jgi:putative endonuclease
LPSERQHLGDFGERTARAHLEAKGLRVVDRKFRTRETEIDLVAIDGDQAVFVEVRTRRGAYEGMAALSVTRGKQRKLLNAVQHYLEAHPEYEIMPLRIDVVAIELDQDGKLRSIDHIEDAVRPDRRY